MISRVRGLCPAGSQMIASDRAPRAVPVIGPTM